MNVAFWSPLFTASGPSSFGRGGRLDTHIRNRGGGLPVGLSIELLTRPVAEVEREHREHHATETARLDEKTRRKPSKTLH